MTVALGFDNGDSDVPRVLGGRWELLSLLARGGMGVLYVGQHLQTGRRAAVKVIEHANPEALARFRLEASVCAQVNHPGIVDVFDADMDIEENSCFIAMELLEGCTLREVMDDRETTPAHVIELLISALEPLAAAHAKGFVHRDLKPENLFVLNRPQAGARVKLLDFGIVARQADERLTRAGTAMGTPHYMSPEQATSARDAGPASDVWSLGVMMYEAIRGEVPFKGETGHGVIVRACTIPHVPIDAAMSGVDPAIARLIDRCLAKDPNERPSNAQALADELRAILRPNSLPAARASMPQRSARPRPLVAPTDTLASGVRPSIRTRSISNAANMLAASGVVCSLSALALPFTGVAPGAALLCAAVGGGLLIGASARVKALRELTKPIAPPPKFTAALPREQRPKRLTHPMRGSQDAPICIEMYADLTCAITRRMCQRVLSLRQEHPDEIAVVWKPFWDPQRELAPYTAEVARTLFEREGAEVFWAFFDALLVTTRRVTADHLYTLMGQVSVDMHGLQRALRTHIHRRTLQLCREESESVGVDESPTVIINGVMLSGDVTEDRLHWAYVDAKSAVEARRKVEMGATRADAGEPDKKSRVRGLLIRYRGARNAPNALRRTREQARERAFKLRARARMEGADFADVALRFADSLLEHDELEARFHDPGFADAVVGLGLGEISEPLECDEGFQVVQRIA